MSRCRRNSSSCVERILVPNPLVHRTGQKAINHNLISVFVGFGDISTDCQPATTQHYGLYITHHHHLIPNLSSGTWRRLLLTRSSSQLLSGVQCWCLTVVGCRLVFCRSHYYYNLLLWFLWGKQFVIVVLMRQEGQQIAAPKNILVAEDDNHKILLNLLL